MPTLSMFYGIIIRMHSERGGKHKLPHIHALYGKDEIVLSLTGDVLEGSLQGDQLKLLLAGTALHEDELEAYWKLLSEGEGYFKIEPLK